jgi:hypothetical protein
MKNFIKIFVFIFLTSCSGLHMQTTVIPKWLQLLNSSHNVLETQGIYG